MLDFALASAPRNLAAMPPASRELVTACLDWLDTQWDDTAGLICFQEENYGEQYLPEGSGKPHNVRETAHYALGLLLRDAPGDAGRAHRALESVLGQQFDRPASPYHGTFRRTPEEPDPPTENPQVWRDYDPNWREFIGTSLAVLLTVQGHRLPPALAGRIDRALRLALAGTLARPLPATYTNIALMRVFLLRYGGERFGDPAATAEGEALAAGVGALFRQHGTFEEYNSPTYYGVDFYGLALWRSCPGDATLCTLGNEIEHALWRDVARYYHAGLRNLAGPYDRAYGMDMLRYLAELGSWIALAVGRARAPLPDVGGSFDHPHDFAFILLHACLGVNVPADALAHLQAFQGERQVEQVISDSPRRVATAWVGRRLLLGAEDAGGQHWVWDQYHPATAHWQIGPEDARQVGTLRAVVLGPVNARATQDVLTITVPPDDEEKRPLRPAFALHIVVPGTGTNSPGPGDQANVWTFPGVVIRWQAEGLHLGPPVERADRWEIPCDAGQAGGSLRLEFALAAP